MNFLWVVGPSYSPPRDGKGLFDLRPQLVLDEGSLWNVFCPGFLSCIIVGGKLVFQKNLFLLTGKAGQKSIPSLS